VFSPLLLSYLLRRRGWDVIYLGANVPTAELAETVEQVEPDMVILAAQLLHTAATIPEVAQVLMDYDTMVAYGGLVFNLNPDLKQRVSGHFLGPTIEGSIDRISSLLHKRPRVPAVKAPDPSYAAALAQFNERRALIESHVWGTIVAGGKPTDDLAEINNELAQIITAALKLGDSSLLNPEMEWLQYLVMSHRLSDDTIRRHIAAYAEAADIHLSGDARFLVSWLQELAAE
jgi:methylmalonyl-CoA mutase cobalamin-binding subunit